jgi:hypothetical protein
MAAKKKKKSKKAAKPSKAKKAPAKKSKKAVKTAKKTKSKAKKAPAKKSVKAAARKAPAKKAARKKQTVGEGDYAATRKFDRDQAGFVEKNKANIPAMGKEAGRALDGPQGDMLRDAEADAAARSRDTF